MTDGIDFGIRVNSLSGLIKFSGYFFIHNIEKEHHLKNSKNHKKIPKTLKTQPHEPKDCNFLRLGLILLQGVVHTFEGKVLWLPLYF